MDFISRNRARLKDGNFPLNMGPASYYKCKVLFAIEQFERLIGQLIFYRCLACLLFCFCARHQNYNDV
jgi:hypothetical protein